MTAALTSGPHARKAARGHGPPSSRACSRSQHARRHHSGCRDALDDNFRRITKLSRSLHVARAAEAAVETREETPVPTIKIDNQSDPFATIVKVDFGNKLGDLLDTVQALKNLGYNISRAQLAEESKNNFYITDARTADKVTKSAELEEIRQCIIHNMMDFHPESEEMYGTGAQSSDSAGEGQPLGERLARGSVATSIKLKNELDKPFTRLDVRTRDRPGLLVDIVRTLKDCNCNVLSAEVDTIGNEAQDEFVLTYHGEPLNRQMRLLVKNALHYYLQLAEIEKEESY